MSDKQTTSIEQFAQRGPQSTLGEIFDYLREHQKWWLAPILMVFIIFGVLMLLGGTAAAPFIYTLF